MIGGTSFPAKGVMRSRTHRGGRDKRSLSLLLAIHFTSLHTQHTEESYRALARQTQGWAVPQFDATLLALRHEAPQGGECRGARRIRAAIYDQEGPPAVLNGLFPLTSPADLHIGINVQPQASTSSHTNRNTFQRFSSTHTTHSINFKYTIATLRWPDVSRRINCASTVLVASSLPRFHPR